MKPSSPHRLRRPIRCVGASASLFLKVFAQTSQHSAMMSLSHFPCPTFSEVAVLKKIKLQGTGVYALVLEGREAILEQYALLAAHAERCDQAGIICWFGHFLDKRSSSHKCPNLFLL